MESHIKAFFVKLSRKKYKEQHQLTSTTKSDRYPEIFSALQGLTEELNESKILSYGCSTGEECFSLRKYFPNFSIIGADINMGNIKKASHNNSDSRIKFIESKNELIQENGPYSIILAMSVLCRWEDTKDLENCEKIYLFEKFDNSIHELTEYIEPNGYLALYNSNFRLEDSSSADRYEAIDFEVIKESGFVHKFDRNHSRTIVPHRTVIYQKIR